MGWWVSTALPGLGGCGWVAVSGPVTWDGSSAMEKDGFGALGSNVVGLGRRWAKELHALTAQG